MLEIVAYYLQYYSITIRGITISNLRFADDLLAGSKSESQAQTNSLEKSAASYGMEISHEKSKILINGCGSNITFHGEQLEKFVKFEKFVKTYKYLNAMLIEYGTSKEELLIRLATAMVRLENIWKTREIKFNLTYKLCKSLVLCILPLLP